MECFAKETNFTVQKSIDDFTQAAMIYPSANFLPSTTTAAKSVQIQIVNGQPAVQTNLQQLQTPNGPITVAILPDLNVLRPYIVQVQQRPSSSEAQQPQPTTQNNNFKTKNQKFLPIQPKKNGAAALKKQQPPSKSSSPVMLPKNFNNSMPQGQNFANNYSPSTTIQLTAEDQKQIAVLTDELQKILSTSAILTPENEKLVKFLQHQRSAILEKSFLQQQQKCSFTDNSSFCQNQTVNAASIPNCTSNSVSFATTQSSIPAQIVQINGMPYLAVAANNHATTSTQMIQTSNVACHEFNNRSQDFQRVIVAPSAPGLQLPIRPSSISCQNERKPNVEQRLKSMVDQRNGFLSASSSVGDTTIKQVEIQNKNFDAKRVRTENLCRQLSDDQCCVTTPDYQTSFKNSSDAVSRLLPYHLYHERDVNEEFLDKIDVAFSEKMKKLTEKKSGIYRRFQSILMKQSTMLCPKSEYCLIEQLISKTEGDLLSKEREMVHVSPDDFVRQLIKMKNKSLNETTPSTSTSFSSSPRSSSSSSSSSEDSSCEIEGEIVFNNTKEKFFTDIRLNSNNNNSVLRLPPEKEKIVVKRKKLKRANGVEFSPSNFADEEKSPSTTNDDVAAIPKLLLKIAAPAPSAKRKCREETPTEPPKRVPPLKIKLTKVPPKPQPVTRISSLGLESSDEDDDPPVDRPSSVKTEMDDFLNLPCFKTESPLIKLSKIDVDDDTGNWDSTTAQFIRSKLKINNDCCLSPKVELEKI